MRIAIAQLNYTVGDLQGNARKIIEAGQKAAEAGARLLVTSELAICGYPPLDLLNQQGFVQDCEAAAREVAKELGEAGLALLIGCPTQPDTALLNAALLYEGEVLVGAHHKCLLPTYDVFDEERWFLANPEAARCIEFEGIRLGVHICEDAWNQPEFWAEYHGEPWRGRHTYDRDPIKELVEDRAEILINLSASPWSAELGPPDGKDSPKTHTRSRQELCRFVRELYGLDVILVNQVGANDGLVFEGSSSAASIDPATVLPVYPWANEIAVFTYSKSSGVGIDWSDQPTLHAELPRAAYPTSTERLAVTLGSPASEDAQAAMDTVLDSVDAAALTLLDFQAALELGVRDYVHKTGHKNVIIGLSGGIDSALVTTIACHALGPKHVRCIGMPTRYSSEGSISDSEELCKNLGCSFEAYPIEETFEQFEKLFKNPNSDRTEEERQRRLEVQELGGLALENVQPRIRGTILMALANQSGALVLAPGNKSELAVGYSTLYGDTVGCLEVIGDLYKTEVYRLARFYNRAGELIPQAIIDKEPSAELREEQRDSDSLPDYEVLDKILRLYIDYAWSHEQIVEQSGFEQDLVCKVCRMVDIAEFKRKQSPMVLRVSSRAFGPGRQMPVVNGYRPKA